MSLNFLILLAVLGLTSALYLPVTKTEVILSALEVPVLPSTYELILPPVAAELPYGLGYTVAGAPLVSSAFCSSGYGSLVPVTSPCSCTKLATPLCPEIRRFARPILL
nr:uncharacterized protein LOC128681488 [Plodia interpunctella]